MDATEQRERRKRIEAKSPDRVQRQSPNDLTVTWDGMPVIIRSTIEEVAAGTIMVQRIRYASDPPGEGDVEAIGPVFRAYPYWTSTSYQYRNFAWGPGPLSGFLPYPMIAIKDRNVWVLMMPLKAGGSALDPGEPSSGCPQG